MFKSRWSPRLPDASSVAASPESGSWSWGPVDGVIAAGILAITAGFGIQMALQFRNQAAELDAARQASAQRCKDLRSAVKHLEARRVALAQLRRDVDRYAMDVASRPIVPWSAAVGELSRRRPKGVWTTGISGYGPRFRVEVTAASAQLAQVYTRSLRQSPYVDYAGLPAGEQVSARTQVTGRWTGD